MAAAALLWYCALASCGTWPGRWVRRALAAAPLTTHAQLPFLLLLALVREAHFDRVHALNCLRLGRFERPPVDERGVRGVLTGVVLRCRGAVVLGWRQPSKRRLRVAASALARFEPLQRRQRTVLSAKTLRRGLQRLV